MLLHSNSTLWGRDISEIGRIRNQTSFGPEGFLKEAACFKGEEKGRENQLVRKPKATVESGFLSLLCISLLLVFPTVFHTSFIRHEVVGNYSHLFTIKGSDRSMQPYMLRAHIDVVPAPDKGWDVPPFSGLERDGFIYGRGTLDNKNSLMVWNAVFPLP